MFNSIAVVQHRALGRDTISISLTAVLLGGLFALGALALNEKPEAATIEVAPLPRMIEVMLPPLGGSAAAKATGKRKAAVKSDSSPAVAPSERIEAAVVLTDPVVASAVQSPVTLGDGGEEGPLGPLGEGGDGIGDIGGGEGEGRGPGDGSGAKVVHVSELQVKLRVQPRFPEAARTFGRDEENCVLRITVNELGEPEHVAVRTCPAMVREAAVEAAYGWRWYPLVENGRGQRAQFDLNFVFRLR